MTVYKEEKTLVGVTKEKEEAVPVKCSCCKKRLFDMEKDTDGMISIKCPNCGTVIAVSMCHKKYRCRRRIATQE